MVKTCVQRIASSEILFAGQRESCNKLATANKFVSGTSFAFYPILWVPGSTSGYL